MSKHMDPNKEAHRIVRWTVALSKDGKVKPIRQTIIIKRFCCWCEDEIPYVLQLKESDKKADQVKMQKHLWVCKKHPMRDLEQLNRMLVKQITRLNKKLNKK